MLSQYDFSNVFFTKDVASFHHSSFHDSGYIAIIGSVLAAQTDSIALCSTWITCLFSFISPNDFLPIILSIWLFEFFK